MAGEALEKLLVWEVSLSLFLRVSERLFGSALLLRHDFVDALVRATVSANEAATMCGKATPSMAAQLPKGVDHDVAWRDWHALPALPPSSRDVFLRVGQAGAFCVIRQNGTAEFTNPEVALTAAAQLLAALAPASQSFPDHGDWRYATSATDDATLLHALRAWQYLLEAVRTVCAPVLTILATPQSQ